MALEIQMLKLPFDTVCSWQHRDYPYMTETERERRGRGVKVKSQLLF